MLHFTLLSRSYCHLCEDMRVALITCLGEVSYELSVLDVDQDPALVDLYDELVPVLFGCKFGRKSTTTELGEQLCHYFLDSKKVQEFCNAS